MAKGKKKRTKKQKWWRFLKFQMVLIGLVALALVYYYVGGYAAKVAALHSEAVSMVADSDDNTFRSSQTSIAYDVNGQTISVMKGEKDVYYVKLEDIPLYCQQAIVSIEDKKFYSHHGVDYKAIVRAVWAMVRNGKVTQGASTITQQLARNVFLSQEKTWQRKVEEIYIAVELEKKYSKEDILEFYLNNVYFANGNYGIDAASKGYFNKEIGNLSLSEMAFLCAIPNSPTYYDPVTHFDHTIKRRNLILKSMLDDKLITKKTYKAAKAETITLNMPTGIKNDYAETYTYYCATRTLMAMDGFVFKTTFNSDKEQTDYLKSYKQKYEECNEKLFVGGYRIYTSLDLNVQKELQDSIDAELVDYQDMTAEGVYTLQSAGVCIDNTTGMVRAVIGGRSQNLPGYTLNRAFQSFRQPGSSIKPLIVYTPSLEKGMTADSIVYDEPIEDGPENADGSYAGAMTLRRAVELSKNTVAYNLFLNLTPKVGISYLHAMKFSKIVPSDEVPSAALGGLTNGVSALEMAKGFATIENDGNYREPTCIMKITDASGKVLYQSDQAETVVYKEIAARQMTDILESVMTNGTGAGLEISNMPCAGKTGTTNDHKDGWFVGYTRYYTTAVWVGYDHPQKLPGLSGATYPGKIWHSFMEKIHTGLTPIDFLTMATYTGSVDNNSGTKE